MIPSGCRVHSLLLPLHQRRLPQEVQVGRLPRVFPQRDFMRDEFRDRRYSLRSGLLVCSPPRSPLPLRPNKLAGQP